MFSFFLWLIVFVGIPVGALAHLVSTPERVKSFIEDCDIYDNMGDILSEVIPLAFTSAGSATPTTQEGLQDENSEIAVLIGEILTPEFLETNIEESIDALYSWLDGESEYPEIEINLAEDKEKISQILVLSISSSIRNLPPCVGGPVDLNSIDPFSMECLPTGFDVDGFEEELEEEMFKELNLGGEADAVFEQFIFKTKAEDFNTELTEKAQSIYGLIRFAPILIAIAIALLLLIIMLLIPGIKSKFIFPGVVLILASLPASISKIVVVSNFSAMMSADTFSPAFSNILGTILGEICGRASAVGCMVLSTGVALIVIRIVMRSKMKDKPVEKKEIKKEEVKGKQEKKETKEGIEKKEIKKETKEKKK